MIIRLKINQNQGRSINLRVNLEVLFAALIKGMGKFFQ